MKKLAVCLLLALTGCATTSKTPISQDATQNLTRANYVAKQCYVNGNFSYEDYSAYVWAIEYNMSTWDTSGVDYEAVNKDLHSFYANHTFDYGFCKQASADLVVMWQKSNTHYQQTQYQSTAQQQQLSSTIQCKQFGTFISEVKTFNGGVCPMGYVRAN